MTTSAATQGPGDSQAVQILSTLCNLIVDACRSDSRQALGFKILNSTIHLIHYDRAVLWDLDQGDPVLAGISGQPEAKRTTPHARELLALARRLRHVEQARTLGPEDFDAIRDRVAGLAEETQGLHILWLPLTSHGRLVAGVWLERWAGRTWHENEQKLAEPLADGYGAAWERFTRRVSWRSHLRRRGLGWAGAALLAGLAVFFLGFRPQPLRLVAPCEVIPETPFVVAAPLDGVIQEVVVEPGKVVAKGDLLFVYEKQVFLQEREVARQQVQVIRAQLERNTALAFTEEKALAEVNILKHRLEQEELRLKLSEEMVGRLEVRADCAGVVMVSFPHEWRGRPVRTGERVVTILDPLRTRVRIWLAQDDNVGVDAARSADVFLHAIPHVSQKARVVYEAPSTTMSPAGVPSFVVEAEWVAASPAIRTGLKGTAILYGREASVAYWILRKPWSAMRKAVGW